jgi:putative flippase GtrA
MAPAKVDGTGPSLAEQALPRPAGLKGLLLWAWRGWATRSLAMGSLATVVDLTFGGVLLFFNAPTREAAMVGTTMGAVFTFFSNRYFAFREHDPKLASPAFRFAVVAFLSSVVHGQLVVMLRDWWGVPYVPAKIAADLVVFSFGQLLLLRYVVFPRTRATVEPRD